MGMIVEPCAVTAGPAETGFEEVEVKVGTYLLAFSLLLLFVENFRKFAESPF